MKLAVIFIIFAFSQAHGSFESFVEPLIQKLDTSENSGNELIEKLNTSCFPSSPPFTLFSSRVRKEAFNFFESLGFQGVQFSNEYS